MMTLSVYIKDAKPPEMARRQFNAIVRLGLEAAARHWITHFLPLHFDPRAVQRYQYDARGRRYLERKRRGGPVRAWRSAATVPAPRPAAPLVYTGELKRTLLEKPPNSYRLVLAATANKQTVRVKIPFPHPLRPENAPELVRLTNDEIAEMQRVAIETVRRELAAAKEGATP